MRHLTSALIVLVLGMLSSTGFAFCGFYVSGADAKLYNKGTMVVLMREGTKTVLSMQNDYEGPAKDFALVIPVPQVLKKDNVKTLPRKVFDRIDRLGSPRLVEYWEEDPCYEAVRKMGMSLGGTLSGPAFGANKPKIEAQFSVGEYDVVVLSANDAAGLDTWLRANKYNIPKGAEPFFKPYIDSGMYFFVAKVNVKRVKFEGKKAILSPLRFHYSSDDFQLPIRLGLLNSKGKQDIIINILAKNQRYEVANYPNVFIPTNLSVKNKTRKRFAAFYEGLFAATQKKHPGAVVTEYAWTAGSCDPCPDGVGGLTNENVQFLGGDVLGINHAHSMVLTRLHARYAADGLDADFVFQKAKPVIGGRENWKWGEKGPEILEEGAKEASLNAFQARYIIRHPWTKKVACEDPRYKRWGARRGHSPTPTKSAPNMSFNKTKKVNPKKYVKGGKIPGL